MKKTIVIIAIFVILLALTFSIAQANSSGESYSYRSEVLSANLYEAKASACTKIQSGGLFASDGSPIMTAYDRWGYNYQALMFNGKYCDAYRDAAWCQPYKEDELMMKWNDAWLANVDCEGDGLLDRHFGFDSYVGSGAWLTNHMKGEYEEDGQVCKWEYFVKIVAAPSDAYEDGGFWYSAGGTEIGPEIWNEFAVIQEVINDACAGQHGLQYLSPHHAGFGGW